MKDKIESALLIIALTISLLFVIMFITPTMRQNEIEHDKLMAKQDELQSRCTNSGGYPIMQGIWFKNCVYFK